MCLQEIGLHAPNLLTILDSILSIIEGTYMIIYEKENLHFDNDFYKYICVCVCVCSRNNEEIAMGTV
jgi:hypothetical protein